MNNQFRLMLPPPKGRTELDPIQRVEAPAAGYVLPARGPEYSEEAPVGSLMDYWRLVASRKFTLLAFIAVGGAAALLFTLWQQPVYQAHTTVEVQEVNHEFLNMKTLSPLADATGVDALSDLQTQLKILGSETLIDRTLKQLNISSIAALDPPTGRFRFGHSEPATPGRDSLVEAAGKNLKVDALAQTRILEVTYQSTDPRIAAEFANTLTSEFINQNSDARWKTSQSTSTWLTKQLDELRADLQRSDDRLQEYARKEGLIYTPGVGGQENVSTAKLQQVQSEVSAAQADRVQKEARFKIASTAQTDSLADVLNDAGLRALQANITDLRRQEAQLAITFKPEYSKTQQIRAEIESLEAARNRMQAEIVKRIGNDYQEAVHREDMLNSAYDGQVRQVMNDSQKAIQYDLLRHEVDTNRATYESMLQQVKEAGIAAALHSSNIRVIDPARTPLRPFKPNMPINLGVGVLSSAMLGLIVIVSRARTDQCLHNPGEASRLLGLPELGVIPKAVRRRRISNDAGTILAPSDALSLTKAGEIAAWQNDPSELADSFRAVLASIIFSPSRPGVLAITSAGPMEGKTTTAINLSITLAKIGQKILLIDGDTRKPSLHKFFGFENAKGFATLLTQPQLEPGVADELLRQTGTPGLSILTSGPLLAGGCDRMFSTALPGVIRHYREQFDMIIIDTPPMLHMPDARLMGRMSDAVVLVARAGRTQREAISAAYTRLIQDHTPLLGLVLNDWTPDASNDSYYGNYKSAVLKRYRTPVS